MPGGISLFLLYAAPMAALLVLSIALIIASKKGVGRIPHFRKKRYIKRMALYDKELSANRKLGKRFEKGYRQKHLNLFQRLLDKTGLHHYEPKTLSSKSRESRIKKMERMESYLRYKGAPYDAPYYQTIQPTRLAGQKTFSSNENPEKIVYSKKEFMRAKQETYVNLNDYSSISTTNPNIRNKFVALSNTPEALKEAEENRTSTVYNRMSIYLDDKHSLAAENLIARDKELYYSVGLEMINHVLDGLKEDAYPIYITRNIVKNGKEEQTESYYTKKELETLAEKYEKRLEANITSKENKAETKENKAENQTQSETKTDGPEL